MSKELTFKQNFASLQGKAINSYLGSDKKRLSKFFSAVGTAIDRTPKLMECTQESVMQSFVNAAMLNLDPSGISGECYVLPYGGEAKFQMGYKGYVTLLYRAGVSKIQADIVREKDDFKIVNGDMYHTVNPFLTKEERGKPMGAYVQVTYKGETTSQFMNGKDIMAHAEKFSKSFKTDFTPWKEKNDPELWMWKKTVLVQMVKLLPNSDSLKVAVDLDYQDSVIHDRMENAKNQTEPLKLGNLTKKDEKNKDTKKDEPASEDSEAAEGGE